MKTLRLSSALIFLLIFSVSFGQHIKRKIFFGTYTISVNDSIAKKNNLPESRGVIIQKMVPDATASNLKLQENDVIVKLNDIDITDNNSFISEVRQLRAGDEITVEFIRNAKLITAIGTGVAKPLETSDDYEVIYDEVAFEDGFLRTIINKPKEISKAPAIFFLPGYMCYSLDNIGKHPYGQLIDGLTKKGYVMIRVEKPGEGDCQNTPNCPDIDFNTELAGFEKGLQSLKKYDFIDQDNIFIWGHSLGSLQAIMLAETNRVKGIVVNGTTAYSWFEYLLVLHRYQQPLFGVDYAEIDDMMDDYTKFQYEFLVLKKTPSELSENETYDAILEEQQFDGKDRIYGRNYRFWQQLHDIRKAKALKNSGSYVLSIWNSADIEAFSEPEHKKIIDIVNYYHPDKGTYVKLENTTHAFAKVNSVEHGLENHSNYEFIIHNFNPEIVEITHDWIQTVLKNE